jgi:hypothetical protein
MYTKATSLSLGVSLLTFLLGLNDGFGWVVSFGGFECCFLFVVGGAGNELGSTPLTLILTPLKPNT